MLKKPGQAAFLPIPITIATTEPTMAVITVEAATSAAIAVLLITVDVAYIMQSKPTPMSRKGRKHSYTVIVSMAEL